MSRSADSERRFASFVATLGRGPGRSRALTRQEARDAFAMVLQEEADPHQVGAFLMLLRFRGEDAEEIAGLVEAARSHANLGHANLNRAGLNRTSLGRGIPRPLQGEAAVAEAARGTAAPRETAPEEAADEEIPPAPGPHVDLDWPSYGAGRTRGAPWFLLSALALAAAGTVILMHGSNDFSAGIGVADGMRALGRHPAQDWTQAAADLRLRRFAYLPLRAMHPALDHLLEMRRLFGLRSPVNTVARLLNPADAPFGLDGVFHPPYIDVHLGVAERLGRRRLLVLKGGGGEAERVPLKPASATLWDSAHGRGELTLPAVDGLNPHPPAGDTADLLAAVWRGAATPETPLATVRATIALALLAMGQVGDPMQATDHARAIWAERPMDLPMRPDGAGAD